MNRNRTRLLIPLAVLCTLLVALLFVSPVYAEGETPPLPEETQTTGQVEPVDETQPEVEETPAGGEPGGSGSPEASPAGPVETTETAPEEAAPAEPTLEAALPEATPEPPAEPEETAPTEPAADTAEGLADTLETLDENNLTLVGEDGEALPLASQETEEAISSGDPWFKVGSKTYRFLPTGQSCAGYPATDYCTTASNPFQAAIDYLETNKLVPSDKAIHVEDFDYTSSMLGGGITIDGAGKTYVSQLTGLVGAGSGAIDPTVASTLNFGNAGRLLIQNLNGPFTLSGFNILANYNNPAVQMNNIGGAIKINDVTVKNTYGVGIRITNAKSTVEMTNVNSSGNALSGAEIDNTAGSGKVTITNSQFDNNAYYYGLKIQTKGSITLTGISASRNSGNGLEYSTLAGLTVKNSVFNDNKDTNAANSGAGIKEIKDTVSSGSVTLENVTANDNEAMGISIVTRNGNVTFTNVRASDNDTSYGATIDTCIETGGACTATGTGKVTITNSSFTGNSLDNLSIAARGIVSITNLTAASSANGRGVEINNDKVPTGAPTVSLTNVTSTGAKTGGIVINSRGSITLKNVTSNSHLSSGIWLDNHAGTGSVSILGGSGVSNTAAHNSGYGVIIYTKGAVTVQNLLLDENSSDGLLISNTDGTAAVSVSNTTADGNNQGGIVILTRGAVTLNGVTANNHTTSGDGYAITIHNETSLSKAGVTITNTSLNYNYTGLTVRSKGLIKLTNVSSTDVTGGPAVDLNNDGGTAGITITRTGSNTNRFASDDAEALLVNTNGTVAISWLLAEGNSYNIHINSKGSVTLTEVMAIHQRASSEGAALWIDARGAVTLTGVTAAWGYGSDGYGAYIDNCQFDSTTKLCTGSGNVTIKNGSFSQNNLDGLRIVTKGKVTITNVYAHDNKGGSGTEWGVVIDNSYGTAEVKISGSGVWDEVFNNEGGIWINTNGAVTVSGLNVHDNPNGAGLSINDVDISTDLPLPASCGALTISNSSFNFNTAGVNAIRTNGATLTNVTASNNSTGSGILLLAETSSAAAKLTNVTAVENHVHGIAVVTNGSVTLKDIEATDSATGSGLHVRAKGAVTLQAGSKVNTFSGNKQDGINIQTTGAISLSKIYIHGILNGAIGIYADNTSGTGNLTITNAQIEGNKSNYGLLLLSNGIVTLNTVKADRNLNGAFIKNDTALSSKKVALTNCTFDENTETGLLTRSKGEVVVTNVSASSNQGADDTDFSVFIDNYAGTAGVTWKNASTTGYGITGNLGHGLKIQTRGAISLTKLNVSSNGRSGAALYNTQGTKNVTISGSLFDENQNGTGLNVVSEGSVSLTNVSASSNKNSAGSTLAAGAQINNVAGTGNVTISGSTFNENTAGIGLNVLSQRAISLTNVTANGNVNNRGVQLDNTSSNVQSPVTISTSTFFDNGTSNLYIRTNGAVVLNKISSGGSINGAGADIGQSGIVSAGVKITGPSMFNGNSSYGIVINTSNLISLTNVTANYNGKFGAGLFNNSGQAGVTITSSTFDHNNASANSGVRGVWIESAGQVTIDRVSVSNTGGNANGLEIDTCNLSGVACTTSGNVAVKRSTANNNGGIGLLVTGGGTITVDAVTASDNHSTNISIDNSGATARANVTLNTVNANRSITDFGFLINAAGSISMTKVMAFENAGFGAQLHAVGYDITISGSAIAGNGGWGISYMANHLYLPGTTYYGNGQNGTDGNIRME